MPLILTEQPPKRETLNLRISAEARALIDRAAEAGGKTRTDFILEAAKQAAENMLLDRTVFAVSEEAYTAFVARLDAPAQPNDALRRTMQMPTPWANG